MKNIGQKILKLLVLIVLISVGALIILSALGFNIPNMFNFINKEVSICKRFANGVKSIFPLAGSTIMISGTKVSFTQDGSASLYIGGRNVVLSSEVLNNLNEVFETSGADGINQYLIDALKSIISSTDPADDTIQIAFGEGYRTDKNDFHYWQGDTSTYNLITIKAGDQIIIIQNDKQTSAPDGEAGVYRIDGIIKNYDGGTGIYKYSSNKIIRLDLTDQEDNPYLDFKYQATIDLSNGINFEGDIFKNTNNDQGDWEINLTFSPILISW
ncbi:MAG: hypothetical protein AB1782_07785 [Cyanobacteriota bacterium]